MVKAARREGTIGRDDDDDGVLGGGLRDRRLIVSSDNPSRDLGEYTHSVVVVCGGG